MRVGGRRRIVIPPKLGYLNSDTGPFPPRYLDRKKLSKRLKEGNGVVVFDVELRKITQVEDTMGYYSEWAPRPDELAVFLEEARRAASESN